jgi:hypothetical protein
MVVRVKSDSGGLCDHPDMLVVNIVNSIGLLLDIAGAVMLFRFGLPRAPVDEEGNLFAPAIEFPDFKFPEVVAYARQQKRGSHIGLGLPIAGFVGQLVAVWLARWLS